MVFNASFNNSGVKHNNPCYQSKFWYFVNWFCDIGRWACSKVSLL